MQLLYNIRARKVSRERKSLSDPYIQNALSMMPFYPQSIEDVIRYFRKNYKLYFHTQWWHDLNDEHIYSNPNAKCWVSEITNTLIIHHISYENLFHEKKGRDFYVIGFDTHTQAHFYKFLFLWTRKVKMTKRSLLKRLRFLRYKYCIQNKRFGLALWYGLRYIMT